MFDPTYAQYPGIVFTTVDQATELMRCYGHAEDRLVQTGFFVPEILLEEERRQQRIDDFVHGEPIHFLLAGTGASVPDHFNFARRILIPQLSPLLLSGQAKLTLYATTNADLGDALERYASQTWKLRTSKNNDHAPQDPWQVRILYGRNKPEAYHLSVQAMYEAHVI